MSELQQKASGKLDGELKKAKETDFAKPIIGYLKQRIADDEGLAEDILKESKTWDKCFEYLYSKAKVMAGSKKVLGVSNEVVFEWAEDYFRKEDKDLKPGKPAKKASGKAKPTGARNSASNTKKAAEKPAAAKEDKDGGNPEIIEKPKAEKRPRKPKKQTDEESGQMSIFDLLGGFGG